MPMHADFSLFDEDLTFLMIFNKKAARISASRFKEYRNHIRTLRQCDRDSMNMFR